MHDDEQTGERDESDVAHLLAATGARVRPSAAVAAAVRAEVESEWRGIVAARRRKRRLATWAVAAGVASIAVAAWIARPLYLPESGPIASLARLVGDAEIDVGDGRWSPLATGGVIGRGAAIRTGASGRAALVLQDGVEVRLDSGTRLAFDDSRHARLSSGAVYVDCGADGRPADFMLETPEGSVHHLGTQYEARLTGKDLSVAVREGRVEVNGTHGDVIANAGEVLNIGDSGMSRSSRAPSASDWNWVADVTPPFDIDGRTVDAFLHWAARETGRAIVYASPQAEQEAQTVRLRGTVEGLTPDQAVTAVLATTALRPVLAGDQITIDAAAADRVQPQ